MHFNPNKCFVMRLTHARNVKQFNYSLGNTTLQETDSHAYLGVCITKDLNWNTHFYQITASAYRTLAFIKRNLHSCPININTTAYTTLVRQFLEYSTSISLSPTVRDIGVLLDSRLDMSAQVSNVCRAAYSNLFRIAKIRTSLTTAACKTLVHSHVTSRLDYGNAVLYGISDRLLHRPEMVQGSAGESYYGSDGATGEV